MHIDLAVGEERTLRMRGLGSAGYTWEWTIDGPDNVVRIAKGSAAAARPDAPGGMPPASSSADELITLTGLSDGRVQVHLALRRPWEPQARPLEEQVLEVAVS